MTTLSPSPVCSGMANPKLSVMSGTHIRPSEYRDNSFESKPRRRASLRPVGPAGSKGLEGQCVTKCAVHHSHDAAPTDRPIDLVLKDRGEVIGHDDGINPQAHLTSLRR